MTAAVLQEVPTWDALADLYSKVSHDDEAARLVIDEARRRERLERQRRTRQAGVSAWVDAAHAQYMAAEAATNGNLVRRDSPVTDAWSLWSGTEAYALAHASEELRLWWQEPGNARITITQYRRQVSDGRRIERDERDAAETTSPEGMHTDDRMDADEPAPVRRDAGADRQSAEDRRDLGQHVVPRPAAGTQAQGRSGAGATARPGVAVRPRVTTPTTTTTSREATPMGFGYDIARGAVRAAEHGTRMAAYQHRTREIAQAKAAELHGQVAMRGAQLAPRNIPDPAALLGRVLEGMGLLYTDYVAFPSRSAVIGVTTWTGQAAARDGDGNPIWRAFPRLLLTSRQNGSGKSTVADLTSMLLQCRAGRMSKVTPYGLTKVLGTYHEAAIADDCQNVFRSDKAGTELLTILINGYTPRATWVSGKADGRIENASGPAMIVGKDALIRERAEYLKDLIDRSAVVRMERPGHYMPEVDEEAEARAATLGAALKAVTGALQAELRQAARDLAEENRGRLITDGDGGRTAQIWRPMLAIARVAGGQWYEATLQAMQELSAAGGDLMDAEDSLDGLEDLRDDGRNFWDEAS
jgi:Protein of unknown function (DUF3631)